MAKLLPPPSPASHAPWAPEEPATGDKISLISFQSKKRVHVEGRYFVFNETLIKTLTCLLGLS